MENIYVNGININSILCKEFRIEDYLLQLKIQWLAYESQKYYIRYLKTFIEYSQFTSIEDFNNLVKLRFAYYRLSEKWIKNNTIWKYYKCIRKYYLFLKEIEISNKILIDELPKVRGTRALPKALSEEDVCTIKERLRKRCKNFIDMRDFIIFETFLNTWIRRAELLNIKIKDISNKHIFIKSGKWNKDRVVYISSAFSKIINDYLSILREKEKVESEDRLFGLVSVEWVSHSIRRTSLYTKIPFSPHLLRHTYASLCVKKWINLYTIQQQMGHTDLKTTSVYLYLNSKENWEEIQKFSI